MNGRRGNRTYIYWNHEIIMIRTYKKANRKKLIGRIIDWIPHGKWKRRKPEEEDETMDSRGLRDEY